MAEVYLAQVTVAEGLSKRVVVKKIRKEFADQPEFTRMFVEEAKIALGLNHANIVQVFDFGQVHGSFYLAMELVEGLDLMGLVHSVRARGERVPVVIAAYIANLANTPLDESAWIEHIDPSLPCDIASNIGRTSAPRTSPTITRCGSIRNAARTSSASVNAPTPSVLASRASSIS
mgnify:CR=1 FL=1